MKISLILNTIIAIISVLIITILLINHLVPTYSIMFLYGDSMQPTINKVGVSIVDTSQTEIKDFEEGDLIAFNDYLDNDISHRVTVSRTDEILIRGDNIDETLTHRIQVDDDRYKIYGKIIKYYSY
mgnify:CR=1 FL=1